VEGTASTSSACGMQGTQETLLWQQVCGNRWARMRGWAILTADSGGYGCTSATHQQAPIDMPVLVSALQNGALAPETVAR
jgi:hypothetical protein